MNAVCRDRKDIHQYILLYSGRGFSGAIIIKFMLVPLGEERREEVFLDLEKMKN